MMGRSAGGAPIIVCQTSRSGHAESPVFPQE